MSLAVIKTYYNDIDRLWVPVTVAEASPVAARELQELQRNPNCKELSRNEKNQLQQKLQKTKSPEISTVRETSISSHVIASFVATMFSLVAFTIEFW